MHVYVYISAQCCISYRNQSFDLLRKVIQLLSKSNDWFLYEMQHLAEMSLDINYTWKGYCEILTL